MENVIDVQGLRKSFKDTKVLEGVDFEVHRGDTAARLSQTERWMR